VSTLPRFQKTVDLPPRYALRSLLGEGGSGRVYRVRDSIRDRVLALKLVTPAESSWLRREFDTLRQIRHENLIQVFDWGALESGEAYYTMELIEGKDWGRSMGSAQPPEEVRRILTGLLRGLAHLHCHGEIHGDLKPGNVLLGRGGVVKVTDVGMGEGGGEALRMSGTPGYAAPEIWEGAKAGVRSDLYSVGVMAYEALTGAHPFGGRTVRDVVSGQLEGWVPSPGAHGVRVPADLERVVMRAVERNADLRQGSADEFMEGMGVEDRIGEILGGRFVGREEELAIIGRFLHSKEPSRPTLLNVTGPLGIGKTALLSEASHRLISAGGSAWLLELRSGTDLAAAIRAVAPSQEQQDLHDRPGAITALAGFLGARSEKSPLLIWAEPAEEDLAVVERSFATLARYLWALSVERGRSSVVLLAIASEGPTLASNEFSHALPLAALPVESLAAQIDGIVGRGVLQLELIQKLHSITGGVPGAAVAATADLIARKVLDRWEGSWLFREVAQIRTLEVSGAIKHRAAHWERLGVAERRTLGLLSLTNAGLTLGQLVELGEGTIPGEAFHSLCERGWLKKPGERWSLASEDTRRAVQDLLSEEILRSIAARLLSRGTGILDREDLADLHLMVPSTPDALPEGLWAAEKASTRGNYLRAVARLRACLRLTTSARDPEVRRQISLSLATAYLHLGQAADARDCLAGDDLWGSQIGKADQLAEREHSLGLVERDQGHLDLAREHFKHALALSEESRDKRMLIRSHAELAEIDWRYGDDADRTGAIKRVGAFIEGIGADAGFTEEIAGLYYQLGSAMILVGERREAKAVLRRALGLPCGDHWRMRLANALGVAAWYLGEFDESLSLLDESWRFAERAGADAFKPRILSNRASVLFAVGRVREAADADDLVCRWALRTGGTFEYVAGCFGAAMNSIILGRYEESIKYALSGGVEASRLQDLGEQAKALELEAQALYSLGQYGRAKSCVLQGLELLRDLPLARVRPRLDWLLAKLQIVEGNLKEAEEVLQRAEQALRVSEDWEDVPGVQIELDLLRSRAGQPDHHLRSIRKIAEQAVNDRALVVQLYGALAASEILVKHGLDDSEMVDLLDRSLGRAEQAGMLEMSWRLSFWLGELASRRGDERGAQVRYNHALRAIRDIADHLSSDHRKSYLAVPHVRSALERLAKVA